MPATPSSTGWLTGHGSAVTSRSSEEARACRRPLRCRLVSVSVTDLVVSVAGAGDAEGMVEVIHAAFGARPTLDPPSTASHETPESVRQALAQGGGVYATVAGRPAGVILVSPAGQGIAAFQRVSVHPDFQRHGIASAMVAAAEDFAAELGYRRVELFAREELAELIAFWHHRGFGYARSAPYGVFLAKALPVMIMVPTAAAMRRLGARLAGALRAGDLVIAAGDLGAGKTTLTQGIGAGLGSEGPIISPTFVLSRVHRSATGQPDLVHVDAYRLTSAAELDDLDLDSSAADAVTVVEWGAGLAEGLAEDRLEIGIHTVHEAHHAADPEAAVNGDDHERLVVIRAVGRRWHHADLEPLREAITDGVR
jgi:tRNA threonylcarbamoyladenosine biosynthesis protein TsaE